MRNHSSDLFFWKQPDREVQQYLYEKDCKNVQYHKCLISYSHICWRSANVRPFLKRAVLDKEMWLPSVEGCTTITNLPTEQVTLQRFQVEDFSVYLCRSLTMNRQVKTISSVRYYDICNMCRVRQYITTKTCKALAQALVLYQMDHGNAFLYSLSSTLTEPLRRVQNFTVRLVSHTSKSEHTTPVLNSLHWLPVIYR